MMAASSVTNKPRIVPAIPLNLPRALSTTDIATPDSSHPSASSDIRLESITANGFTSKGIRTPPAPHRRPPTPDSKSSTPASGPNVRSNSLESSIEALDEEHGSNKADLPATPVSNTSTSPSPRKYKGLRIGDVGDVHNGSELNGHRASGGDPPFSPQTGTYRLPPPFYPSEKSTGPTPSSQEPQTNGSNVEIPSHVKRPRPKAMSLVFGGMRDSASSSPAPYSPTLAPQQPVPPPHPSSFIGNVNAAPFYPAISMPPFSLPDVEMGYSPISAAAPAFPMYSPTQPWIPVAAPFPFPVAPDTMPQSFGQSMSPALSRNSSSKPQASRPGSSDQAAWQPQGPFDGSSQPFTRHESLKEEEFSEDVEHLANSSSLEGHVLSQFGRLDYADCLLEVYLINELDAPFQIPAHRLMLTRSPRLAAALAATSVMPAFDMRGLRVLSLWDPSRFSTTVSYAETVRYLYGGPVPSSIKALPKAENDDSAKALHQALCFVTAGSFLELSDVAENAFEEAVSELSWESIETALSFALDGADAAATTQDPTSSDGASPAANEPSSITQNGEATNSNVYATSYESQLLAKALDFIANNFPTAFSFDATAPQLTQAPRLPPPLLSSRPSSSDPRLSKLAFGDLQGEAPTHEARTHTTLSSVLLSLPFHELNALLAKIEQRKQLGPAELERLARAVVDERERRRLRARRSSRSSAKMAPVAVAEEWGAVWENLFWEEAVEEGGKLVVVKRGEREAAKA